MALPWHTLESVDTEDGVLELRSRAGRDFLITIDGRVLMNSAAHGSEVALGELACGHLSRRPGARVLVGGLGMGYTLRAVLDLLPPSGRVVVAEINPVVVAWCRGPMAGLTAGAVEDPRVVVEVGDVAALIRGCAAGGERFDAVVLDLYEGPHGGSRGRDHPLYGRQAVETARKVLVPGGIFAVWGEDHDPGFERRLRAAGFSVACHRPGRGGARHVVYVGRSGGPGRPRGRPRPR